MKWLYASLVAVFLVGCSKPDDPIAKIEESLVGEYICESSYTIYPQGTVMYEAAVRIGENPQRTPYGIGVVNHSPRFFTLLGQKDEDTPVSRKTLFGSLEPGRSDKSNNGAWSLVKVSAGNGFLLKLSDTQHASITEDGFRNEGFFAPAGLYDILICARKNPKDHEKTLALISEFSKPKTEPATAAAPAPSVAPSPAPAATAPTPAPNAAPTFASAKPGLIEVLECRKWKDSGPLGGLGGATYSVNNLAINKLNLAGIPGLTTKLGGLAAGGEMVTVTLPETVAVYGAGVQVAYLLNQEATVEQQVDLRLAPEALVSMVEAALGIKMAWDAGMEYWIFEQDQKYVSVSAREEPGTSRLSCGFT